MSFFGDLIASVGNQLGLPELGISEKFGSTGTNVNPVNQALVGEATRLVTGEPTSSSGSTSTSTSGTTTNTIGGTDTRTAAPTAPTGPSQAQTDPLLAALSALDTTRQVGRDTAVNRFNQFIEQYDAEDARDRANFEKQTSQNERNLATNRQAALLSAAQGGQRLRSFLASLGALSGTGSTLADRAIGQIANKDIGEATNTFDTNADSLGTAWSEAERQQRQRRAAAEAARENDIMESERNFLQGRQGILGQLSNLFGANTAQGRQYASEAASLYAPLASARPSVAQYQEASPLFSEQALANYRGGARDLTVQARPTAGASSDAINSPLFATTQGRRRDELE